MSYRQTTYRQQGWGTISSYLFTLIFMFLFFSVSSDAFQYLGFSPYLALLILFLSVLTSGINIPVTTVESRVETPARQIRMFGITFQTPPLINQHRTVIAVNFGGAVIPVIITVLLWIMNPTAILYSLGPIFIGSILIYFVAQPIKGVGVAVPFLVPAFTTTILTLIFAGHLPKIAPIVAYSTGVLSTIIGADLLNIPKISQMKTSIASIGGAGTFDGIFISGVFSVALLTFFGLV